MQPLLILSFWDLGFEQVGSELSRWSADHWRSERRTTCQWQVGRQPRQRRSERRRATEAKIPVPEPRASRVLRGELYAAITSNN